MEINREDLMDIAKKSFEESLVDSAKQYGYDMEKSSWKKDTHIHFFWERVNPKYRMPIKGVTKEIIDSPEFKNAIKEIEDSPEYRKHVMKILMEKVKDLDMKITDDNMRDIIEFCPESVKYIDLLDGYYHKDEVIINAIKKDPSVIDYFPKEKLSQIVESYESDMREFRSLDDEDGRKERLAEEHEKYRNGDPTFIIELIKNNPAILESNTIQEMLKDDPSLEKKVRLFQLSQQKQEIEGEIESLDAEIAEEMEHTGDKTEGSVQDDTSDGR